MKCCVINCNNDTKTTSKHLGISFHSLPTNIEARDKWLTRLNQHADVKENCQICSEHFLEHDFYYNTESGAKCISSDACPFIPTWEYLETSAEFTVCRICLSTDSKMFDLKEDNLQFVYQHLTGLLEDMVLPQVVCYECRQRLRSANTLRNKAIKSHTLLSSIYNGSKCLTIKDVKQINRHLNELKSNLTHTIYKPIEYNCQIDDSVKIEIKTEPNPLQYNDIEIKDNGNDEIIDSKMIDIEISVNEMADEELSDKETSDNEFIDKDISDSEMADKELNDKGTSDNEFIDKEISENEFIDKETSDNECIDKEISDNECIDKEISDNEITDSDDDENDDITDIDIEDDSSNDTIFNELLDEFKEDVDNELSQILVKYSDTKKITANKKKVNDTKKSLAEKNNKASAKRKGNLLGSLFTIIKLTQEEQIKEMEQRQESKAYKKAPFKCTICYRGYRKKHLYDAHMLKHSEQFGAFECSICKMRINSARKLRSHVVEHHSEKYSCNQCQFVTKSSTTAKTHAKWHAGCKYKCLHCSAEFEKIQSYSSHLRLKHSFDFICSHCGYSFANKRGLDMHKARKHRLDIEIIPEDGPYCEMCDVKFISEEAYSKHVKLSSKHSTGDVPNTSSAQCRRTDSLLKPIFTTTKLTKEEQIQDMEQRKERTEYKSAPYKCTVCYRGFQEGDPYESHMLKHSENFGAFECSLCKLRTVTSDQLRKHVYAHHTEKYSCNRCLFVTNSRAIAKAHAKWHIGTKYKCPHCSAEFEKPTTYFSHLRLKHVSDFVCCHCGYSFVSQKGMDMHISRKHKKDIETAPENGPYCDVCDVKFFSEDAYSRHFKISSKHLTDNDPHKIRNDPGKRKQGNDVRKKREPFERPPTPERGPVTCEQCGKEMENFKFYAQHFRKEHPGINRTKFSSKRTICMCDQCGRLFLNKHLLQIHMWIHTGEKKYKCSVCPKSFTLKNNFIRHEMAHNGNAPTYECKVCGKHFSSYSNRSRHMMVHTDQKPYKCDICDKSFKSTAEQRAHVDHVHLRKPWPKRVRKRRRLQDTDGED